MSLRQLKNEAVTKSHFVPQAIVKLPPSYFASKGWRFSTGHDDLDEFKMARFSLDDKVDFALLRYRGAPRDETTVFLPGEYPLTEIQGLIYPILDGFSLPRSVLQWIRTRSDTPF